MMIKKPESGICWLVAGLTDQQRASAAFLAWDDKNPNFQLWLDEEHEKYFKKPGYILLYQLPRNGAPELTYFVKQEAAKKFAERSEGVAAGMVKILELGYIKVSAFRPQDAEFADSIDYEEALEKYFELIRKLQPPKVAEAAEDGFVFYVSFAEARKQLPAVEAAFKALSKK